MDGRYYIRAYGISIFLHAVITEKGFIKMKPSGRGGAHL